MLGVTNKIITVGVFSMFFGLAAPELVFAQNTQNSNKSRVVAGNGKSAMGCVKLITLSKGDSALAGGGRVLSNQCGETVEVIWCYVDGECNLERGAQWTIAAGKSWPVSAVRPVRFAACYGANTVSFEKGSEGSRYICNAPFGRPGEKTPKPPSGYRPSVSGEAGANGASPTNGTVGSSPKGNGSYTPRTANPNSGGSAKANLGTAQPARLVPGSLSIGENDYPLTALRAAQQGTVGFRVSIGPDGMPSQCTITASSGYAELDQAACSLVLRRSRFRPAQDGSGQPISSTYSNRIRWQIPEPLPPTTQPSAAGHGD
jgi:TonB family protein